MFHSLERYTVESVTSGHPDKVCDQISDAILDACLKQDRYSRVAVESFGSHGTLILGGEVKTRAKVDFERIARKVYRDIGYTDTLKVLNTIAKQSPDIAMGVDTGGAGDQGIMYGYATNETASFLPEPVERVQNMMRTFSELCRSDARYSQLGPDGKGQLTYEDGRVKTILLSLQHKEDVGRHNIKQLMEKDFLPKIFDFDLRNTEILINPSGSFTLGGFAADAGLTGRKIMVDTYCGLAPHGGGAFSGKDPSKVDRSGAYYARYVAKNIVAHGLAKEALVSVGYAIGKAEPLMVHVEHDATGRDRKIKDFVRRNFDFRPKNMIAELGLRKPIYAKTAIFGHFGNDDFSWERIKAV